MNPDTPILMITLQIPVTPDTTADEVLHAIGRQVTDALVEFREQQAAPAAPSSEQAQFRASVIKETEETFTAKTGTDLLSRLGYSTRS